MIRRSFGSWIRTIRPGLAPSELVTAIALRNSLPQFLADDDGNSILTKFLGERIDLAGTEENAPCRSTLEFEECGTLKNYRLSTINY